MTRARAQAPKTGADHGGSANERGHVIVEFAAISMVLVILIFGVIEGGLLFRSKLALSNSTDEAVRRAAVAGNSGDADWQILQQIVRHSADDANGVTRVIVYRADDATSEPIPTCSQGISTSGECNVYDSDDFERPSSDFGACGPLDGNWCPTDRDTTRGGDLVGVMIQGRYAPISGVVSAIGLDQRSVLPFEAETGN